MALAHLTQEIPVGTILWIKKLADSDVSDYHGLPPDYFMHPCVVLYISRFTKGFAQIYVITSKSGRNIDDVPLPRKVRRHHVPIHPTPVNSLIPGVQLYLKDNIQLRKRCYVNTQKVYTFPVSKLELYDRYKSVNDFCLDSTSIDWLKEKAFGEPLRNIQIEATTAPAPTSEPPNSSPLSHYTIQVQPALEFDAASPHRTVHRQGTIQQPAVLASSRSAPVLQPGVVHPHRTVYQYGAIHQPTVLAFNRSQPALQSSAVRPHSTIRPYGAMHQPAIPASSRFLPALSTTTSGRHLTPISHQPGRVEESRLRAMTITGLKAAVMLLIIGIVLWLCSRESRRLLALSPNGAGSVL